ncbi:molecular chaperone MKKS-like isoform X1 [Lycorma delicatula]|uniref:molecular chaperone MKKS-like isoform X1 n=1 Tax=Lycorma delicatula TaxID=130591 RepID=UPI003F50E070
MFSVSSARSADNIIMIPMKDPLFISILKEFKNMLKSSVGPNGNLKILVSGGGYIQLTSSSSLILQHYDQFDSPIVQFIAQIVKGQIDYGLYVGLIVSSFVEHFLSLQYNGKITAKQSISLISFMNDCFNKIFDSDKLKIRLSFNSINDLTPLVRSVLQSKCHLFLSHDFMQELCVQIIKAFLFTLDTENMTTGKVIVQVFTGKEELKFCPGIVYQLVDGSDSWIYHLVEKKMKHNTEMKTLLFTTMLTDEKSKCDANYYLQDDKLKKIFEIVKRSVELGVTLIACQKVVHKEIVLYLRRKSVIVLERMGTDLANSFKDISGSCPISDINKLILADLTNMIGVIKKVNVFEINTKLYLLMECHLASVVTLIFNSSSLCGSQQIKLLVEQALKALRVLVSSPYVCPGAGCFETSLFFHLKTMDEKKFLGDENLWVLNALLQASGHSLPVFVDTVFKHAWSTEDQLRCNCHLISRDIVFDNFGSHQLISLYGVTSINDNTYLQSSDCKLIKMSPDAIVDSFLLKRNAVAVSIESCINLLGIGTVVYKKKS